jgi:hypothetical protein
MAKRIIFFNSASHEIEQNMIGRLKDICGAEYASKLQRMITDVNISFDLNSKFKATLETSNENLGRKIVSELMRS